jgi:glyoxylase-like metal-dependent hydrolase (beta-lactamase superfamily II)
MHRRSGRTDKENGMTTRPAALLAAPIAALALLLAAPAPAAGKEGMKLYVFTSGSLTFAKAGLQQGAPGQITIPVGFYIVKHPKGVVLFDTGNNDRTITDAAGYWGPLAKGLGLKMTSDDAIDVQLAKIGVKPSDVKFVILGHMHLDHAGNMTKFPNATFIVQKEELAAAGWPEAGYNVFYISGDFEAAKNYSLVRLEGGMDLFGDKSVEVVRAPGHTPGSQFAVVRLPKTGTVVLTSDTAYLKENLEKNLTPGTGGAWSPQGMLMGYEKIRAIRDAEGASIFYAHDPEVFKATKKAPEYYE